MTDYKLDMGTLETALQKAFELGGLEDGSYHLEAEEIEQVIRAVVPAVQGEPVAWLAECMRSDFKKPLLALHLSPVLADETCRHWKSRGCDVSLQPLYTTPQPVEQQENVSEGWRSRFLKFMGEMQSELDESNEDPIPSGLWSLWRELLDTAPQPAEQQPTPDELSDYGRGFRDGKLDRLIDEVVAESELVEALEQVIKAAPSGGPLWHGSEQIVEARAALAAYRKQVGEA